MKIHSYDLVEWGKPLQKTERKLRELKNSEVIVEVTASGLCHSDLHFIKGFMDLGENGKLTLEERGMKLPSTLGHEIAGKVKMIGPKVKNVKKNQNVLVFPWIGCGECLACDENRESDCMSMRIIGLKQRGGFASHVLVEHEKYLVDIEGLDPSSVVPHCCSGITVFNGLSKLGKIRENEWLAIIGSGGLGLNAISIAKAMDYKNIIAIDIDDSKLKVAKDMGASKTINSKDQKIIEKLKNLTNNLLFGVLDTVGNLSTCKLAVSSLNKTGKYVIVGQHGGDLKVPIVWLPQKAMTIRGSHVGNYPQLKELINLVRDGKIKQMPIDKRPLTEINTAIEDLQKGKVIGRIVLHT